MFVNFNCAQCRARLEIETDAAGSQVNCPECGAPTSVPHARLGPGLTVGGFRIQRLIGRGGMAEVYLATQLSLSRPVALKILPPAVAAQPESLQRFLEEVRLLARLQHPYIVTAHEAGNDAGVAYLAMAYVDGESVYQRIKRRGPLPEREALAIVYKMASALAYAWNEHQLLHRDIKPANILLDTHGEPRLADLGLARTMRGARAAEVESQAVGTPNYMSPEQAAGEEIDARADMYSLGATLYHMLTGQAPFEAKTPGAVLQRLVREFLPDPRHARPEITPGCVEFLAILLAREPRQRYGTWEALARDLAQVAGGGGPSAAVPPPGGSVLNYPPVDPRAIPPPPEPGVLDAALPTAERPLLRFAVVVFALVSLGSLAITWAAYSRRMRQLAAQQDELARPVARAPADATPPAEEPTPDTNAPDAAQPASASDAPADTADKTTKNRPPDPEMAFVRALQYGRRFPDDFAGQLERLRMARDAAAGTPVESRIQREIEWVTAAEARRARGPDRPRTVGTTPPAWVPAARELDRRLAEAAEALRQLHYTDAVRELGETPPDGADAKTADVWRAARGELERIGRRDEAVLAAFAEQRGEPVELEFADGRRETLMVADVDGGGIWVRKNLPNGYAERLVTPAELSRGERWRRLPAADPAQQALLRGMMALQMEQPGLAAEQFRAAGGPLARAIADRLAAAGAAVP